MKRSDIISTIRRTLRASGVKKAYLFGSFARNERGYRDIDVAVLPPRGFSLMDMAGVQIELEDALGKKVDLVSIRAIRQRLMPYVRNDLRAIM